MRGRLLARESEGYGPGIDDIWDGLELEDVFGLKDEDTQVRKCFRLELDDVARLRVAIEHVNRECGFDLDIQGSRKEGHRG